MKTEVQKLRSSKRWQQLRLKVFQQQGNLCALCRQRPPFDLHHKTKATPATLFDESDLVALCGQCYAKVKKSYSMGFTWNEIERIAAGPPR